MRRVRARRVPRRRMERPRLQDTAAEHRRLRRPSPTRRRGSGAGAGGRAAGRRRAGGRSRVGAVRRRWGVGRRRYVRRVCGGAAGAPPKALPMAVTPKTVASGVAAAAALAAPAPQLIAHMSNIAAAGGRRPPNPHQGPRLSRNGIPMHVAARRMSSMSRTRMQCLDLDKCRYITCTSLHSRRCIGRNYLKDGPHATDDAALRQSICKLLMRRQ